MSRQEFIDMYGNPWDCLYPPGEDPLTFSWRSGEREPHPGWSDALFWQDVAKQAEQFLKDAARKRKHQTVRAFRAVGSRHSGWRVLDAQGGELARYGPELGTTSRVILERYRRQQREGDGASAPAATVTDDRTTIDRRPST